MGFEFATATRIVFGAGSVSQVPELAGAMGRRAALVTGSDPRRAEPLLEALNTAGVETIPFAIAGEPTTHAVAEAAETARRAECDCVVAVGGGSVLDAGKALAALLTNRRPLLDYLEVVGLGLPLDAPSAPCIAVPTTAGTGAEVTRNAVLGSPEHRVKVSMRSEHMLPRLAVVDPELTHSMPSALTAATGLDAVTQLMEAFTSRQSNPLTDGICREGLARAGRSLERAFEDGADAGAREDMAVASLFGGMALANAKLGAVHGFAGPLGGMFPAPHGQVCAALLPHVMRANLRALERREPRSPALGRYEETARILTGKPGAAATDGAEWIAALCAKLNVPPLSEFGVAQADIPDAVAKAKNASSMKGNPVALLDEELAEVLERAI